MTTVSSVFFSVTRHALLVTLIGVAALLPSATHAATPHLSDPTAVKTTLACQKVVQKAGASLIARRRHRLASCADAGIKCATKYEKCKAKARRSKKIDVDLAKCELAQQECAAKTASKCAATMDQLVNGANLLDIAIRDVKKCGALDFTDQLTSDAGLGFGALADACRRQFGLVIDSIVPLSQCIVRQYACQADKLVEAEIPRARELLRTAGVPPGVIDAVAPCLEDHEGSATVPPNGDTAKVVAKCNAQFRKNGKKFSAISLAGAATCLNEVLKCVQTKPDNADCIGNATVKCHKAVARLAAKGDAMEAAVLGRNATCANAYQDLDASTGGNRQALSCACELAGVKPVTSLAEAAHCLRRVDECRIAKILPFAVPRAAELLQLVGLTPADLLCSFNGTVPVSTLAGRTFGRALSARANPTVPTIRNLLTGAGNSSGPKQSAKGGSKFGNGSNSARALAARRRILPDASARLVTRYAKRHGVSLTVIGVLHDGTPNDDGVLLDGYFDVPEASVTDEVDTSETHLVLDYPRDVTACAFELGVMVGDDEGLSEPVLFGQQAVEDPSAKLLTLEQVEEEDVSDEAGKPPVHGLEGDRWVVVSRDGKYVYAAGASNTIGFCHIPADPTKPYCSQDSDCGAGGPCLINKPRMTSDALVSFSRDSDGRLHFQQTVSFGPEALEPELQIAANANPLGIAVSDDNANIYVALAHSNLVVVLTRDVNGNLTFKQKITVADLQEPRAILVSQDGKNVYVAAGDSNAVVVFSRAVTGGLTFLETKQNGKGDVPAQALGGATALAIDEPVGHTLYVAAAADSAVTALQRNPTTGALTFIGTHRNGVGGVTNGLTAVRDVGVSPDGKFAYSVSFTDRSVLLFARNTTTGALTFVEQTTNGSAGADLTHPLEEFDPTRAVVSPDGLRLYVSGGVGGIGTEVGDPDATIVVFARDVATGKLSYLYDSGGNQLGSSGLIAVSPDSTSLYATTQLDASVGFYSVLDPISP